MTVGTTSKLSNPSPENVTIERPVLIIKSDLGLVFCDPGIAVLPIDIDRLLQARRLSAIVSKSGGGNDD